MRFDIWEDMGIDRRTLLRTLGTVGATTTSVGTSGCLALLFPDGGGGSEGKPISFASQRQRITPQMADQTVTTRSDLINAVEQPDTTVWIPGDVTIDMTGESRIMIANNVIIASDRNLAGGKGGLIKTNDQRNFGLFITKNADVHFRMSGVRFKGPRTDYFDPEDHGRDHRDYSVTGVRAYGKSLIIDNCEVFGWTNAGFVPGTSQTPTQGWFHHNSMHHNQMAHLGYPMDLYNGLHLIEWNYFDHNRHSIAGFGYPSNGYEARFNVVGPNANHPAFFSFDMHSLGENIDSGPKSNSRVAGKFVNVHHNVFEQGQHPAISLSGVPQMFARFCYNWVVDQEGAVDGEKGAELRVRGNIYGSDRVNQGREWLKQLSTQLLQLSNDVLLTKPKPTALPLDLSPETPPDLSNSSTTTNSSQQSTPMNSTQTPQTASRVNPITSTELTPVGGGH